VLEIFSDLCKMINKSQEKHSIDIQIYSLVVPKEILDDFEISKVEETVAELAIYLVEKLSKIPDSDHELVRNGFMNSIEIQGFPIQGKPCYYKLSRRRWKEQGTKKDYFNTYTYVVEGSKTTQKFGSFLKELGL